MPSIIDEASAELAALTRANRAFMALYPGDRAARQPVHTVYGGAQLYRFDTTTRLGELALRALASYGRDPFELARGVGIVSASALDGLDVAGVRARYDRDPHTLRRELPAAWLAVTVYDRVLAKLGS